MVLSLISQPGHGYFKNLKFVYPSFAFEFDTFHR